MALLLLPLLAAFTALSAVFSPTPLVAAYYGAGKQDAQLSTDFYDRTCPNFQYIAWGVIKRGAAADPGLAPALLRLFFHDCFVIGCDASVLLDEGWGIQSEKNAKPNKGSLRGFETIDAIKESVEKECPGIVSCADILAVAAQISLQLVGGPDVEMPMGRRDGTSASFVGADNLPSPIEPLDVLKKKFADVGLSETDLVALSGAHTIGKSQCQNVNLRNRLYDFLGAGKPDMTVDASFLAGLQQMCPRGGDGTVLNNLDPSTPDTFDNNYYANLVNRRGVLRSDQELFSEQSASAAALVRQFAGSRAAFFQSFTTSMIKMGNINALTGSAGQIRKNCRTVNAAKS